MKFLKLAFVKRPVLGTNLAERVLREGHLLCFSFIPKLIGGNPPALNCYCAVPCCSSLHHVADYLLHALNA